jgi:hypothetical protein
VANVSSIFGDRDLSAAASGACSVNIIGSNTLFKMMNDVGGAAVSRRDIVEVFREARDRTETADRWNKDDRARPSLTMRHPLIVLSFMILNNVFDPMMLTEQAPLAAALRSRSSNIPAAFAT